MSQREAGIWLGIRIGVVIGAVCEGVCWLVFGT